jgi:hypothetical protein
MSALRHPLHLFAIIAGAISIAAVLWGLVPAEWEFVAKSGCLTALIAAVDLARRLGLEPPNDPASPHNRKVR